MEGHDGLLEESILVDWLQELRSVIANTVDCRRDAVGLQMRIRNRSEEVVGNAL